jgi:thiol-disulfide isomerase/thioredoxin
MRAIVSIVPIASIVSFASLLGCSSSSPTATYDAGAPTEGGTANNCQANGATYPAGPCGINKGQPIADLVFQGKTGGTSAPTTTVTFDSLYDPTGSKGNKLLLLDVSALWCMACKGEAMAMPTLETSYAGKGVVFMTVVAENDSNDPASAADVDSWITAYGLTSLVVDDPTLSTEAYFDRSQMPLNMIVDLRTMTIVTKLVGYDDTQIRAQLDAALAN